MSAFDAIVVGAGHNGLVAAAYLAKAGRRVLVVERAQVVGGAAATEEIFPGYRVDVGAHRLNGLSSDIVSDLGLGRHGFEPYPAGGTWCPAREGSPLLLGTDPAETAARLEAISPNDARRWVPFTELLAKAADIVGAAWATTPPDVTGRDLRDLVGVAKLGLGLRKLGKKDMVEVVRILPMSVYELVDEWFESDVVKGALAAAAVAGLCQGPMGAGTAYTLIHHQVRSPRGALRPTVRVKGGVGRLSEALAAACRGFGAEVRTGTPVERVIVEGGRAVGVALADGSEVRARTVASSADPRTTFFDLLEPGAIGAEFARKVRNVRYRGVCAKVHLAVGAAPSFSGASVEDLSGVVSISPSLEYVERAYDDAKYGFTSEAPCLEVSVPSLTDPTVAPEGKHLVSIVAQYAPYCLRDGSWDDPAREALGDRVVATLAEYAPDIGPLIEHRHVMTPVDIERRFGLTEGNIYHGEMTLDQLLFMRPVPGASRYRTPVEGLYLCGAGSHPGGGVTGVPGYNAAREILRSSKR